MSEKEKKPRVKLIGLDLDGTLFTNHKTITERSRHAIEAALFKGVVVVPATGRPLSGIPEEFLSIPKICYALTSNGASVWDLNTHSLIHACPIPLEEALELMDFLEPYDNIVEVYQDGSSYSSKRSIELALDFYKHTPFYEYIKKTRKPTGDLPGFLKAQQKPIEKFNIIIPNPEKKEALEKELLAFKNLVVTSASSMNLELNHKDATKGSGLIALGAHLGVLPEEIMACGDSSNDFTMIRDCGLGVAMGNAQDSIKEAADFITLTNEEDGVAHAIETFVLS